MSGIDKLRDAMRGHPDDRSGHTEPQSFDHGIPGQPDPPPAAAEFQTVTDLLVDARRWLSDYARALRETLEGPHGTYVPPLARAAMIERVEGLERWICTVNERVRLPLQQPTLHAGDVTFLPPGRY